MGTAKLAGNSLLTAEDQARLYAETMGAEAAARQERLAKLERGQCVCEPRKVRRRWAGDDAARVRMVHDADCPRYAAWMSG